MSDQPEPQASTEEITANITPPMRLSMPDFADYHGVSDSELAQLETSQTGTVGNLGFTALGGVIGSAASGLMAISNAISGEAIKGVDVFNALILAGSLVATVICFIVAQQLTKQNKSLTTEIRGRKRRPMPR